MPTYEYRCPTCGWRTELNRPMADVDKPVHCDNCGNLAKLQFVSAPCFPWYPGSTREVYKERRKN